MKQALLLVLLCECHRAGDGVACVDRGDIVKVHLRGQEAYHATNMRNHAGSEQARDNGPPEPTALNKGLINMVRVVIAGYAAEQSHVSLRKGASKSESLPHVYRVKSGS